jgi:8-oxo-dGTP diphosphatase
MTADALNAPTIRVSLVIINEQEEILLVKHQKKDRQYWVLPGGHLDFGETIAQCALRELKEETGLQGMYERLVAMSESLAPEGSRHIVNVYALVKVAGKQSIELDTAEEIIAEAAYKKLSELGSLTVYPNINEFILAQHKANWPVQGIEELQTPWT